MTIIKKGGNDINLDKIKDLLNGIYPNQTSEQKASINFLINSINDPSTKQSIIEETYNDLTNMISNINNNSILSFTQFIVKLRNKISSLNDRSRIRPTSATRSRRQVSATRSRRPTSAGGNKISIRKLKSY